MKGRKRYIITDTQGLMLAVKVHPVNRHDNKAAMEAIRLLKPEFKRIKKLLSREYEFETKYEEKHDSHYNN